MVELRPGDGQLGAKGGALLDEPTCSKGGTKGAQLEATHNTNCSCLLGLLLWGCCGSPRATTAKATCLGWQQGPPPTPCKGQIQPLRTPACRTLVAAFSLTVGGSVYSHCSRHTYAQPTPETMPCHTPHHTNSPAPVNCQCAWSCAGEATIGRSMSTPCYPCRCPAKLPAAATPAADVSCILPEGAATSGRVCLQLLERGHATSPMPQQCPMIHTHAHTQADAPLLKHSLLHIAPCLVGSPEMCWHQSRREGPGWQPMYCAAPAL